MNGDKLMKVVLKGGFVPTKQEEYLKLKNGYVCVWLGSFWKLCSCSLLPLPSPKKQSPAL
jgi:hypothetical protein